MEYYMVITFNEFINKLNKAVIKYYDKEKLNIEDQLCIQCYQEADFIVNAIEYDNSPQRIFKEAYLIYKDNMYDKHNFIG